MAGNVDTGIKVIPVLNNLGKSLLVMTCYVLILPRGNSLFSQTLRTCARLFLHCRWQKIKVIPCEIKRHC